ncbi:MAG: glycosyltransferase family 4 protein [Opitutaceae bacterium]|nr:glycosyltransferase family 4 protein [Opitutaceae bacterium]
MKIVVLQDYLRSGGTERQTVWLTRAIREQGHEARILTFRPGGALALQDSDVPIDALQPFDLHLDWFAPGLGQKVQQLAPEVVLAMGRMANCHAGSIQRRLPRTKVVTSVRTGKPLPFLYRRSLRLSAATVANSRETAERLAQSIPSLTNRIHVIHNSLVFAPRIQSDPESRARVRLSLGAAPGDIVLLSVAMFRPEKNQRAILEAAARLPAELPWRLWMVGDGPARAECVEQAHSLGLSSRVRFWGFEADPRPYYEAADLAVHASLRESLSNFLAEAQAHGLPAAVFDAQGVNEAVISGETGFVVPSGDVPALTRAIATLTSDSEARAKMGRAARKHAIDTFSPEVQVAKYLDLFSKMAVQK